MEGGLITPTALIGTGATKGVTSLLLPGKDAGIDFAREYELAKGMAGD